MISYRDAVAEDAAVLDQLFTTSFCDTFAHLYRPEDLQSFLSSFSIADWRAQLQNREYLFRVGQADGVPVGYVKLGPLTKLPVETERPAFILDQLYILKEHHGTGIARQLMEWAMAAARRAGAEELYLTVYVDNHRARAFYDRYGFEQVGRYDFMVGTQADEDIIMRKML